MSSTNNSGHYIPDKNDYQHGYKKYLSKAQEYFNNKERSETLLKEALGKAAEKKGALSEVWEKLNLLIVVSRSWIKGEYKEIPKNSILMIIATIIYFVSPIDLIPDILAGFGFFDDAAVIGFTIKQISSDLEKFKAWKMNRENEEY